MTPSAAMGPPHSAVGKSCISRGTGPAVPEVGGDRAYSGSPVAQRVTRALNPGVVYSPAWCLHPAPYCGNCLRISPRITLWTASSRGRKLTAPDSPSPDPMNACLRAFSLVLAAGFWPAPAAGAPSPDGAPAPPVQAQQPPARADLVARNGGIYTLDETRPGLRLWQYPGAGSWRWAATQRTRPGLVRIPAWWT